MNRWIFIVMLSMSLCSCARSKGNDMVNPYIDVLGVYRLPVTKELFQQQFDILYGYPMSKHDKAQAERHCRDQLSTVVLVEALVHNRDSNFSVDDFTQRKDGVPEENWQAPWAEAFLTSDGQALSVNRWSSAPEKGDLRIAFYMHYWQPNKPLLSSYGEIVCPAIREMPERLVRLVPFEPVD